MELQQYSVGDRRATNNKYLKILGYFPHVFKCGRLHILEEVISKTHRVKRQQGVDKQ
jgi:hypothetical protein